MRSLLSLTTSVAIFSAPVCGKSRTPLRLSLYIQKAVVPLCFLPLSSPQTSLCCRSVGPSEGREGVEPEEGTSGEAGSVRATGRETRNKWDENMGRGVGAASWVTTTGVRFDG